MRCLKMFQKCQFEGTFHFFTVRKKNEIGMERTRIGVLNERMALT
jgi:hypothetical protein